MRLGSFVIGVAFVAAVLLVGTSNAASRCSDKGGVCQATFASCGGGYGAKSWSAECGTSSVCCVTSAPATASDQYSHATALSRLSSYLYTGYMCSSRTSGCKSLEGVNANLIESIKTLLDRLYSVPTMSVVTGTDLYSNAAGGGLCSSSNVITLSPLSYAATLAEAIRAKGQSADGSTNCYNNFAGTSSEFYVCITYSGDLAFSYCPAAASTSCGSLSATQYSRLVSQRSFSFSTATALSNAEAAAYGSKVSTPSGSSVCMDANLGYYFTLGFLSQYGLTIDVVSNADALYVSPNSRLNSGRAIRFSYPYTLVAPSKTVASLTALQPATFASSYEFTVPSKEQLFQIVQDAAYDYKYAYSGTFCTSYRNNLLSSISTINTDAVMKCLEQIPVDGYDASDYCSMYTNSEIWDYVFSCYRIDQAFWNCYIEWAFETTCQYFTPNSHDFDNIGTICNQTLGSVMRVLCGAFYNSGWRFNVQANTPTATLLQDLSASSSSYSSTRYITYEDHSRRLATQISTASGYSDSQTKAAIAREDVLSSSLVYKNAGGVQVSDVITGSSSTENKERAVLSGAVLLVFCVLMTAAAVAFFVFFFVKKDGRATARNIYVALRTKLCVVILVLTVVSAASMNWAQSTTSSKGVYTTMSNAGMCRCASSSQGCPVLGNQFNIVNAIFSILYIVSLFLTAAVYYVAANIRNCKGFSTSFYNDDDYGVAAQSAVVQQAADTNNNPTVVDLDAPTVTASEESSSSCVVQLVEKIVSQFPWIVTVLTTASFVLAVITLIVFGVMQTSCLLAISPELILMKPVMSWGFTLRIVETSILFVIFCGSWLAVGGEFKPPRQICTWSRRQFVVTLILPLALASASSSSWMIQPFSLQHFSPFTVCTCRGWTCETTLGAHRASFALYTVFYSFYAAFFWLRIVSESRLYNAFFSFAKDWSISNKLRLGKRWRVDIGRVFLGIGVVTLAVSLLIFLSVVLAAKCGLGGTSLSYGFIFAALAYVGVLVVSVLELLTTDVFGDGFEDDEAALNPPSAGAIVASDEMMSSPQKYAVTQLPQQDGIPLYTSPNNNAQQQQQYAPLPQGSPTVGYPPSANTAPMHVNNGYPQPTTVVGSWTTESEQQPTVQRSGSVSRPIQPALIRKTSTPFQVEDDEQ